MSTASTDENKKPIKTKEIVAVVICGLVFGVTFVVLINLGKKHNVATYIALVLAAIAFVVIYGYIVKTLSTV